MGAIPFRDVQRAIVVQHEAIRARLLSLKRNAERGDSPRVASALRSLLFRFAADFDAHLRYEERELCPRIRDLDAWGEAREEAMHAEHREQRRQLERIYSLALSPSLAEGDALADEVLVLSDSLLRDMREEDHLLTQLVRIAEDGHVDQMTG